MRNISYICLLIKLVKWTHTTEVPDPDGFFGTSYKDVTISIYFNRKTEKVVLITDNCGLFNRIKFEKDFKDIIRDIKLSNVTFCFEKSGYTNVATVMYDNGNYDQISMDRLRRDIAWYRDEKIKILLDEGCID